MAEPEDACANLTVPVLDSKPWIALIKRSERARTDCSFDIKVGGPKRVAAGYSHHVGMHMRIDDWEDQGFLLPLLSIGA